MLNMTRECVICSIRVYVFATDWSNYSVALFSGAGSAEAEIWAVYFQENH